MRVILTDEFLAKLIQDNRPAAVIAAEMGRPVKTIQRWRYEAYKRFDKHPGAGVRPGWKRCPTCSQTVPPSG